MSPEHERFPTYPQLTGAPRRFMQGVGRTLAWANRVLHRLPPGRWLHNRLHVDREISSTDLRLPGGPGGLDRLEIAYLSDLHAGLFMTAEDLGDIASRVAALQPDLVCLGGDLINTRPLELELYEHLIELLDPPLGIFAVPGNHEHFYLDDISGWERFLEERGVRVLVNRGQRVERDGASLWICGIDDLSEGQPDLRAALSGRREGEPTLLLSHHPDAFVQTSAHVDVQISGHTHGGQIRFFGWSPITHSAYGYAEGLHRLNGSQLYVGRGAGVTTLPIRIGTRSEIPILRLRTDRGRQ